MDWLGLLVAALQSLVPPVDDGCTARLAGLDRARAEAFAQADAGLLDAVYVRGSPAARADAAVIRAYAGRDVRVEGAVLEVLSCRVVRSTPDAAELDVVDRLGAARAVWADGRTRDLPNDLPTRRTVSLVRTADGWRVAGTEAEP
jgi:hypothetical protein